MGRVLVIGATGRVGRHVVRGLLVRQHAVLALSRLPHRHVSEALWSGIVGDATDPAVIEGAMEGVDSVFLLWPTYDVRTAPPVIDAMARKAKHVVFLSAHGVPDDPGVHSDLFHARIERLILESGVRWTMLRPTGFASNTLGWAGQIQRSDTVRWPYGQARRALIHEKDIAAVAVEAIAGTGHAGKRYLISGPEQLSQVAQVERIGRALGRPLAYVELAPKIARAELMKSWGSAAFVDAALNGWAAMMKTPEPVTTTVSELIGRPALTFTEWVEDHIADFGGKIATAQ